MGYGILNGCLGAGAVVGAVTLPKLRAKYSPDQIVFAASLMLAGTLATMPFAPLRCAGSSLTHCWWLRMDERELPSTWPCKLSAPAWVQGRAQGIYQMTFQGGNGHGARFRLLGRTSLHPRGASLRCCHLARWNSLGARYRLPYGVPPDLNPSRSTAASSAWNSIRSLTTAPSWSPSNTR